ncbi:hypothetical protein [Rhodoferax mekongensis]|uniref:Uncharacterized protein n=1 Tax=Rhodoferax mekongensis TaxID=3068341 RepID=A0ABZ0AW69_9BURK|nr:hypothetical protein [Rhodoferax sp. TBRC 17307]NBX19946.1 hypothetical protein [Betaproteobacteria bacterium]WNO03892.1 hypothetical protein RAN89_13340 [Rhodoferax sp. TBRC 17307]
MSPTVESLLAADAQGARRLAVRYAPQCPCCEPKAEVIPGKPRRRASHRPVMAWRARLAALETLADTEFAETVED